MGASGTANGFLAPWDPSPSAAAFDAEAPVFPGTGWGASARAAVGPAVLPRPRRAGLPRAAVSSVLAPLPAAAHAFRTLEGRDHLLQRTLEILPAASSLLIITFLFWGAVLAPLPLAVVLMGFDVYWVWRSMNTGIHVMKGYFVMRRDAAVDWQERYYEAKTRGERVLDWDRIRHIVIIPNYKESIPKLSATLAKLAESEVARQQIFVVMAMEEADPDAHSKAEALYERFGHRFAGMFATFHPSNLAGEVRGKSSNEAWAARCMKRTLVDEMGYRLEHITVTSCDADTLFHPRYFSCLSYKFATDPRRYRRFWQAPIFLYNNIWQVPAPLRVPNGLGGLNHLVQLVRQHRLVFPQSCYSLSLQMAAEVGYWDVDVVPEDWHMFLKCFYTLGGEVDVDPIYLPVGNDGVRAHGYMRTFWEHYQQARRHAWGATDIPYAFRHYAAHPEIPFVTRLRRTWSVYQSHVLWSSQWWIITVGRLIPSVLLFVFGVGSMPFWFSSLTTRILFPCIIPLIIMILMDTFMRPPRPKGLPWWYFPVQFVQWVAMAPITFFFTAAPAMEAQIRLALGKRLEYKVTEKA